MTVRTRVAMTYEEVSPGVPYWGPNTVTTDLLPDQTEIAIENLVAGRTYYIKTWNEDQFGNKSPERLSVINTPGPTRMMPLVFSANGAFDSGSPMYAYVKIPDTVVDISEVQVTLAFRQFLATARDAAASATETSDTSGTLTSNSGGADTSGSSSAGSSSTDLVTTDLTFVDTPAAVGSGVTGAASAGTPHTHGGGSLETTNGVLVSVSGSGSHNHSIPHHHSTPDHQHTIPGHDHDIPGHGHALEYGTFEETYPVSHSVYCAVSLLVNGTWIVQHTFNGLTADLVDIDMTGVIRQAGDWRITIQSNGGQPNDGRLGCDIYGNIIAILGDFGGDGGGALGSSSSGAPGRDGVDGADGADGAAGPAGPTGLSGPPGYAMDGDDGPMGPPGERGPAGAAGSAGPAGPTGLSGPPGYGQDGDDGADGPPGPTGQPGAAGAAGPRGFTGDRGSPGDDGDDGYPGPPGAQGFTGAQGVAGPTGLQGPPGFAIDGDDGYDGVPGQAGAAGAAGATGAKGNVGDRGAPGADGDDGDYAMQPPMGWHGPEMHNDILRSLMLTPNEATIDGTSTIINVGASPNLSRAVNYPDAATSGAFWWWYVPEDFVPGGALSIRPLWTPSATDGVAHTVRFSVTAKRVGTGTDVTAAGTTTAFTGASATRTVNIVVSEAFQTLGLAPASGERIMIELQRIGADAADTYVGAVRLLGLGLQYSANQ